MEYISELRLPCVVNEIATNIPPEPSALNSNPLKPSPTANGVKIRKRHYPYDTTS